MALFAACGMACVLAAPATATSDLRESFDLQVPQRPAATAVEGRWWLAYELHLTNFSRDPLTLQRVEVYDAKGAMVARLEGDALASRLGSIDKARHDDSLTIAQGARSVLYVELDLEAPLPKALVHRVAYMPHGGAPRTYAEVRGGHSPVWQETPPVLGPPVRGGPWVAIYDPSWPRGHRRVLYTVDGRARIPGRFAVDWMRVDDEGLLGPAGSQPPEGDYAYGVEVLAVADAVVAVARDGVPEASADAPRERALHDAAGNYVVLRLDNGLYVFYEHLAPGSLRVAPGERVRKGDVIAAIGSTGSSRRAHLHFHVADHDSPLGAEGLPFVLEAFTLLGDYSDFDALGSRPWTPHGDSRVNPQRVREMPAPNAVLQF